MSYKRLIISLLILSLIVILPGCLGKLIPTTPQVTSPAGRAGVLYLEPANLSLTPSQDFTVELKVTSITNLNSNIGSGLAMTHFFNNEQVLMKNVSLQDLTPAICSRPDPSDLLVSKL